MTSVTARILHMNVGSI